MHTSLRRSIMVVVDSQERSIRPALEQREGMPSIVVLENLDALQHYLQQGGAPPTNVHALRPGLILLNVDLSYPDAREALQTIMVNPGVRPIPILALVQENEQVGQVYDLGINACIKRPETVGGQMHVLNVLTTFWYQVAALPNHFYDTVESYRPS